MVILIGGASHTGKTLLAQKLLEKYQYPYLSLDHLKMGLIRSGQTKLTPVDDEQLTGYLWPIAREMIKTAIENGQNLIVEGCYIPFDFAKDFEKQYLSQIKYICLVMSSRYIKESFEKIKSFANVIEHRIDDSDCRMEQLEKDNQVALEQCLKHGLEYLWIDTEYNVPFLF